MFKYQVYTEPRLLQATSACVPTIACPVTFCNVPAVVLWVLLFGIRSRRRAAAWKIGERYLLRGDLGLVDSKMAK
jgi:hypothetical protein